MPGREYVVQPEGDLDIANVPALSRQWLGIVAERTPDCFIIDLAKVTFLDSTGLGAIVAVNKQQAAHGGQLIVINASPRLAKIFQMTGLGSFIGSSRPIGSDSSSTDSDGAA